MTIHTVGIDLGTTNSVACSLIDGQYRFIPMGTGNGNELPSSFLYQNGTKSYGNIAKRRSVVFGNHYISSSKTYLGNPDKVWTIDDKDFSPTDVAAEVLTFMFEQVKKDLNIADGEDIEAVITVPAYFTSNQIDETKKAGIRAGFIVNRLITEPVAAAIAYGNELPNGQQEHLFIFDLGGGTFDVSILKVDGSGNDRQFKTVALGGDQRLGGDDFDEVVYELLLEHIRINEGLNLASSQTAGIDETTYVNAKQKLIQKAEQAKRDLGQSHETTLIFTNLLEKNGISINFEYTLTQRDFIEASQHLIDRIKNEIEKVFEQADCTRHDISRIILVGGSSQLPFVREMIENFFNKAPYSDIDHSKIVAMGAANMAYNSSRGIGEDKIIDIISHSLGIRIIGNRFSPILLKNDQYPVKKTESYTTTSDYQESINIEIFEGDAQSTSDCEFYGEFELDNIEIAPEGVPEILVTFEFDENRILKVEATDVKTNSKRSITIDKVTGLLKI